MTARLAVLAGALCLGACATSPATIDVPVANSQIAPVTVPAQFQYLYGSAESAAASRQAYNALLGYVLGWKMRQDDKTPAGGDADMAVLAPGATLASPTWLPCEGKPPAVVFDVDETALLNYGFEYDDATHPGRPYDEARWQDWERNGASAVRAVPGAVETIDALRAMGVTVVFNSNRSAANAQATADALESAGLGTAIHGQTLFLKGDLGSGSGKDSRRAAIAARYCVLAMGGDQLGDFTDLFTGTPAERRAEASADPIGHMFGLRWFVLPNPVYGTAIKGGIDDVFPPETHWAPEGAAKP